MRRYIHWAKENLAATIADYTTAVTIDLQFSEVYLYLGIAYKVLGEFDLAIEDYNKTLAIVYASEKS